MTRAAAILALLAIAVACVATAAVGHPAATSKPVTVPAVVGLKSAVAQQRLRASGLRFVRVFVHSTRVAGTVLRQRPAARTRANHGTIVRLTIATGVTTATPSGSSPATPS
jgi:beta-lactam-binding protein with PASTA domain